MTTLTQATGTNLYLGPSSDTGALLFYACGETPAATSIEIRVAWELRGWLVMMPSMPTESLSQLEQALARSGVTTTLPWTGFLWTIPTWNNDSETYSLSNTSTLALHPLRVDPMRTCGLVPDTTPFTLGRYGLLMQRGAIVTPIGADPEIASDLDITSFSISYGPDAARLPPPNGVGCSLPMTGQASFCFVAQGFIGDLGFDPGTGFDAAITYVVGASPQAVSFPVFEPLPFGTQLLADLQWDPTMNAATGGRTVYSITGEAWLLQKNGGTWEISQVSSRMAIPSCFRTVNGGVVSLTPGSGAALIPTAGPNGTWTLVPSGPFVIGIEGAEYPQNLLCGLSGSEYITLPGQATVMTFVAGPATAPLTSMPAGSALLSSGATTGWVAIQPPQSLPARASFFAQPVNAPLFGGSSGGTILDAYETLVTENANGVAFPMIPYGLASGDVALLQQLEHAAIAPARMQQLAPIITPIGAAAASRSVIPPGGAIQTMTPQGLLVTVTGTAWSNLILATDGTNVLAIESVPQALQLALQSNELFLVFTNPIETFTNLITIAGWTFSIDVGSGNDNAAGSFANVLIFKFCHGTLAELAGNPSLWASPAVFNTADTTSVSQWITNEIAAAASSTDTAYGAFNAIAADPNWNGIVALQVDVGTGLPPQLLGLLAGIDMANFFAHHVVINVNRVDGSSMQLAGPTSLAALIDYVDSDPSLTVTNRPKSTIGGSTANAYSFRVVTLLAEFSNSNLVLFESNVVLTITQLFGDTAASASASSGVQQSSISLNGHLESHRGQPVYTFTSGMTTRFLTPESAVLFYVDVTNAQFHTQGLVNDVVTSTFTLAGFLSFQPTQPLDIFSFGNDPDDEDSSGSALAYANLAIGMAFVISDPQNSVTFTFDPSGIAFDMNTSVPRAAPAGGATLFTSLPLTLDGVLSGTGSPPQQSGYFPIVTTEIQESTELSSTQWYALAMSLDLGNLGSLASTAGFTGQLLAAWSPGGVPQQVAMLLQLPGTSTGKQSFSLESVLRVGIGQVSAALVTPAGTNGPPAFVELTLSEVGLVFLGITLPTGGGLSISLFANPAAVTTSGLGWYALYSLSGLPP